MDRLTGLGSFLLVTGAVLLGLRLVHVGVPVLFPGTRPGPVALRTLDEVERRAGFVPLVPAYRPATLGDRPESVTVTLRPHPALAIVWRGERFLASPSGREDRRPIIPRRAVRSPTSPTPGGGPTGPPTTCSSGAAISGSRWRRPSRRATCAAWPTPSGPTVRSSYGGASTAPP
jgi:hypothetical protein